MQECVAEGELHGIPGGEKGIGDEPEGAFGEFEGCGDSGAGDFATPFGAAGGGLGVRDFDIEHGESDPSFVFGEIEGWTRQEAGEEEYVAQVVEERWWRHDCSVFLPWL